MISLDGFSKEELEAAVAAAFPDGLIDHFWFIAHAVEDAKTLYRNHVTGELRPPFEDMPDAYRKSVMSSIMSIWHNANATPEEVHDGWMKRQTAAGWSFGDDYDKEGKKSPSIKPFAELDDLTKNLTYITFSVAKSLFKLLIITEVVKAAVAKRSPPKLVKPVKGIILPN